MVDYLSPAQQAQWISELRSHILDCVKDINGNHVRFFLNTNMVAPLGSCDEARRLFKNYSKVFLPNVRCL